MPARPCSKSPPTILSMSKTRHIALPTKLFLPRIVQVTAVRPPSSLNANSALLVAAKGLKNSSLKRIASFGRLSMMLMRPSPTSLFPAQDMLAPVPAAGPSKLSFACGSFFAHGDQARHLRSSFTCANTAGAGAANVAERDTLNSSGRVAMYATSATMTTATPMRTFTSMMRFLSLVVNGPAALAQPVERLAPALLHAVEHRPGLGAGTGRGRMQREAGPAVFIRERHGDHFLQPLHAARVVGEAMDHDASGRRELAEAAAHPVLLPFGRAQAQAKQPSGTRLGFTGMDGEAARA